MRWRQGKKNGRKNRPLEFCGSWSDARRAVDPRDLARADDAGVTGEAADGG